MYDEEELKMGQGGDTPLCPFDCDCCKKISPAKNADSRFLVPARNAGERRMWRSNFLPVGDVIWDTVHSQCRSEQGCQRKVMYSKLEYNQKNSQHQINYMNRNIQ